MENKTRFVVFEGVDGTGKTAAVKELCEISDFVEFDFLWERDKIVHLDDTEKMPLLLNTMRYFDKSKIYVIDRFLFSDMVYNPVLRGSDAYRYAEHLERFTRENEVLFIYLDRDHVSNDYRDDKIHISRNNFNSLIDGYRDLVSTRSIADTWTRRIVFNGHLLKRDLAKLIRDIAFAVNVDDRPLQKYYANDPMKFFLSCIALNQSTGMMARRVMPEFFSRFKDIFDINAAREPELRAALNPLGLGNRRALSFIRAAEVFKACPQYKSKQYLFSREEILSIPGLGPFAADSYMAFIRKSPNRNDYSATIDKVVKVELESLIDQKNTKNRSE